MATSGRSQRELDDRAQVVEPVAGVEAAAAEQDAVHPAALAAGHLGQRLERVGELDLAAPPGRRVPQHVEDGRVADVAPDDDPVARARRPGRASRPGRSRVTTSSSSVGSIAATPYSETWSESTSISATTRAAELLADLDHALQQRVAGVDEVVAEQHGERLVADVIAPRRAPHGRGPSGRPAGCSGPWPARWTRGCGRAASVVALGLERLLQLGVPVEVVLDARPCRGR